ncbi:MAG: DUF427 domain-containing protein [Thermoleophilia bacterium]|nr:DUF427 domain-containing protein [Thermoleophilia bacterium]
MKTVRASLNGVILAEAVEPVLVEGNHYFPPGSIRWEHLSERQLRTICPWKGVARYYDVEAQGTRAGAAAWTYHHPFPWVRRIRDHVAFWSPVEVGGCD